MQSLHLRHSSVSLVFVGIWDWYLSRSPQQIIHVKPCLYKEGYFLFFKTVLVVHYKSFKGIPKVICPPHPSGIQDCGIYHKWER